MYSEKNSFKVLDASVQPCKKYQGAQTFTEVSIGFQMFLKVKSENWYFSRKVPLLHFIVPLSSTAGVQSFHLGHFRVEFVMGNQS